MQLHSIENKCKLNWNERYLNRVWREMSLHISGHFSRLPFSEDRAAQGKFKWLVTSMQLKHDRE